MYPVPFRAEHLERMRLQTAQQGAEVHVRVRGAAALEGEHSHTLMDDGEPIGCCGAFAFHANRALVWSYIGADVGARNFRAVHTWAKRFVDSLPFRRVEAEVECGFSAGHRWLRSLGFDRCEAACLRAAGADGQDHALYARVKGT